MAWNPLARAFDDSISSGSSNPHLLVTAAADFGGFVKKASMQVLPSKFTTRSADKCSKEFPFNFFILFEPAKNNIKWHLVIN